MVDINCSSVIEFMNKLERVRKSALPNACRNTLNIVALNVKQHTMIEESDKVFKKRKPTFFNATSKVEFASGKDICTMKSVVGFIAPTNKKEAGHATKDLEEQEHGGDIDKRAFIAADGGRTAKGNVKANLLMSVIKNEIWNSNNSNLTDKSSKSRFVVSALYAKMYNGFLLSNKTFKNGNKLLYKVLAIHKLEGGKIDIELKTVYIVKGKRKAHVKATHFMKKASEESVSKINNVYKEQAEKELNRIFSK